MHIAQLSAGPVVETHEVYYSGTDEVKPGYVLCADLSEDLVPQAGEFDEMQRGRVFKKPATANLAGPKRIVVKAPSNIDTSDKSGWCVVVDPAQSSMFTASVDGTTDVAVGDYLIPVDGEWHLAKSASAVTAQDMRLVVGIAREPWTDNSAKNMLVFRAR